MNQYILLNLVNNLPENPEAILISSVHEKYSLKIWMPLARSNKFIVESYQQSRHKLLGLNLTFSSSCHIVPFIFSDNNTVRLYDQ